MADPRWWEPRPLARQGERMGEEPYPPFGRGRRVGDGNDERDRRDPRNTQAPPVIPQQAAAEAAPAVPAAPQPQRGLLDMLTGALANPANPGAAAEGQRSGYGPIPGGLGMPARGQSLLLGQMGLDIMQGRPIRGPMGIGVNPYYGSYR